MGKPLVFVYNRGVLHRLSSIPILGCWLAAAVSSITPSRAEEFGLFTYLAIGNEVRITDYPTDAVGPAIIPSTIEGLPVTRIDIFAFENCSGVTSISIPSSVDFIAQGAFSGCSGLTSITLPPGVGSIPPQLFQGCSGLTSIALSDNIGGIGSGAFADCSGLTSMTIPRSVSSISVGAFPGCSSLTSIEVDPANSRYMSIDGVLFNSLRPELVQYPPGRIGSYTIPAGIRDIGWSAFSTSQQLTSITIPSGVTHIGDRAFAGCTGLIEVSLSETVTNIGGFAFFRCRALTEIILPDTINVIGGSAFRECTGLRSVDLPTGIMRLLGGTFFSCTGLTCVSIPEGVSEIRSDFNGCTGLTDITLPSTLTRIGDSAFRDCSGLTSVVIPENVDEVDFNAFNGCSNLGAALFLGDSPTRWGSGMFDNVATEFAILYLSASTGFTSPTWVGYPAMMIDEVPSPSQLWLMGQGYSPDTDLESDPQTTGVSLLMSYALNLDPESHTQTNLPQPVIDGEGMRMTFYSGRPDVTYIAETTTDFRTWSTEGLMLSDPAPNKTRTASVDRDAPFRALRLRINVGAG